MTIKVLLADDHTLVREGVKLILEKQGEIEVVGSVGDGRAAVKAAQRLRPDVAIFDISMPELNGVEAVRQVAELCPDTRVIILSMHASVEHIHQAMEVGACGYVLKDSVGKELVVAVRTVVEGRRFFSEKVADLVFLDYATMKRSAGKSPVESLSFREREVMQLVVEGKSSRDIGEIIHLSPKTVESYRSRLMVKLGVKNLAELVKFAIANGLTAGA